MIWDPPPEDSEVLSPELVLVSGDEAARHAREQLPDRPGFVAPVASAAHPAPAPLADTRPPPQPAETDGAAPVEEAGPADRAAPADGAARLEVADRAAHAGVAAPPSSQRPPPPAFPRILVEEPPGRRTHARLLLAAVLLGAAIAVGGYVAETRWLAGRSTSAAAVPTTPPVAAPTRGALVPTAPGAPPVQTTPSTQAARPKAASTRPTTTPSGAAAATAPKAAKPKAAKPKAAKSQTARPTVTKPTVTKPTVTRPKVQPSPPRSPAGFVPARTWAWASRAGATAYQVTFYLDGRVVFRAQPKKPRLVLPRSFRFQAGRYRFTVSSLPAVAKAPLIADSTFVLTAATAAAANRS
jgi:hypothetical protein